MQRLPYGGRSIARGPPQGLFPEAEDALSSFAPSPDAELTEPFGAWSSGMMLDEDTPRERPWA